MLFALYMKTAQWNHVGTAPDHPVCELSLWENASSCSDHVIVAAFESQGDAVTRLQCLLAWLAGEDLLVLDEFSLPVLHSFSQSAIFSVCIPS